MHVAYIHQHFATHTGSTGTRSYEMSKRLLAAGHRVTMFCGATDLAVGDADLREPITESDVDGIRVIRINQRYSNRMGFLARVWSFKRFADLVAKQIGRLDADLVFASSTPLTVGIPGMKGARKLGVPFVFEVRDLWPEIPIAMGVVRNPILKWHLFRLERRIYRAADWIIALSPGMVDGITRTGYPAERMTMIPNASDLDLFQPSGERIRDERFGAPDDFRLVFTGAHGPANGLDAVLDAARVLRDRGVTGVRFTFIGDGKMKDHLIRRARDEQTDHLTTFVPPVPKRELAQLLPRMDVGMMILKNLPSFYYGTSPNKFFDYIAAGLPVINNYPGWLADMIRERGIGRVVPAGDPEAFADAVLALREQREALPAMGRRARELAEAEFSRDILGRCFVQTLEHVHGTPR